MIPDLNPINLSTTPLVEIEKKLLKKGPSSCPTPKDNNRQRVQHDLDQFERRIRNAVFFHKTSKEDATIKDATPLN